MSPPLAKRKAGRPKVSRFKAWFEKGGSSKKGKKDDKPKRPKKVTKIDASCVRYLVTELDLPNVVTLQRNQSKFMFLIIYSNSTAIATLFSYFVLFFQKKVWK